MSARSGLIDDLYETGRVYPGDLEAFAQRWQVDPTGFRRTLNLAAHCMDLKLDGSNRRIREELRAVAKHGVAFAAALDRLAPESVVQLLICLPEVHPGAVLIAPGTFHARLRALGARVRRLAEQAKVMSSGVEVTNTPQSGPRRAPTGLERSLVDCLADFWLKTHGQRANVYNDMLPDGTEARRANKAGCFILETADEFFGVHLTEQRLQSVLEGPEEKQRKRRKRQHRRKANRTRST
jgi:hypothetical protein